MPDQPTADAGALLASWITAFNTQDLDRICSLYAEDAVLWGTFSDRLIASPQEMRAYFERAFQPAMAASAALQDYRLQSLGDGHVASGAYLLQATLAGQRRSLPARFTIVLGRSGGGLQILTHHSSLTPGELVAQEVGR